MCILVGSRCGVVLLQTQEQSAALQQQGTENPPRQNPRVLSLGGIEQNGECIVCQSWATQAENRPTFVESAGNVLGNRILRLSKDLSSVPLSTWQAAITRASDASDKAALAQATRALSARLAAQAVGESVALTASGAPEMLVGSLHKGFKAVVPRAGKALASTVMTPSSYRQAAAGFGGGYRIVRLR